MSDRSAIEWTDATWNPTTGCTKISPGCAHCYIERTVPLRVARRRFVHGHIPLQLHTERLVKPLHWKEPRRIFVNSESDLFHEDVPDWFIDRVFAVMALTPHHTYQVLTKRADRMRAYFDSFGPMSAFDRALKVCDWADTVMGGQLWTRQAARIRRIPDGLANVWLGVSGENNRFLFERARQLARTPATVRFFSLEPLLEDVATELHAWLLTRKFQWVIVGGESGPGARPFDLAWARAVITECRRAGVACFVKQLGSHAYEGEPENLGYGPQYFTHHRKGGDPDEWPTDLRVREFPQLAVPA